MSKYANAESGNSESMYSDAEGSSPESKEPDKPEEKDDHKTYLLPVGVAEGKEFEPGDEIVLRIEAIHDDQFEVSYAPAKEQEKGKEPEGMGEEASQGAEAGGQGGMGSMYD